MNREQMKGEWNQIKGQVKERWGRLTDDELDQVRGEEDQLVGLIQKRYGIAKEEAEREVDEFREGKARAG